MIRVVGFFCVALMGFTTLTLYHISEQARVARQDLRVTEKRIAAEEVDISVLQAQWQRVAGPETIQRLAESSLGMNDTATVQLSSLTDLPRRNDGAFAAVRAADVPAPAEQTPILKISVRNGM
jgi:hypothetical protein